MLTVACILPLIHRQVLAFLVVQIQRDPGLSDTQSCLLLGPSLAVFLALFRVRAIVPSPDSPLPLVTLEDWLRGWFAARKGG